MAATCFDEALTRLLAHEGGYTNHPSDPGGPTRYGITIADYRRHVKPNATAADVRALTVAEARAIYRQHYWNGLSCDALPAGLDYAVFDYGVHSGTARAARVLQRLLGVAVDGRIGPLTLAAVGRADARALIAALCAERLAFLQKLPTWPVFGRGWARRVAEVRLAALAMAAGRADPVAQASAPVGAPGRGHVPIARAAQRVSAGGIAAAGGTAAAQSADPLAILLILVATAALAAAAWWAWRWRQRRRQLAPA